MTQADAEAYCLSLPGVAAKRPYGPGVLVMYDTVKNKSFVNIADGSLPAHLTMKCDPIEAEVLRAANRAVTPGYHCNKRHWNSVVLDGSIPDDEIRRMLWNAYCLVAGKKKEMRPIGV